METPIYTRLNEYHRKNRISFAMPGHKNLRGLAPDLQRCDVTELSATVDLHHEDEYVRRANRLLSEQYKTRRSFILTGGSTAGVMAMLASTLKPGDTLAAAANCHISVINACAVCGFRLVLLPETLDKKFLVPRGLAGLCIPEEASALIVTSPNYYGITEDIPALAKLCRRRGIPLLVDEAHGAHFIGSRSFPRSAVELGADMVCQSAHKTLNALTGAAYLHICSEKINTSRVKRALLAFQSSSPSYPIAASADAARAVLTETDFDIIIEECENFKEAVSRTTNIRVLDNDDPTRIVLCFSEYDITGYEILCMLSERCGIDAEMADLINIVLIATPWNVHNDFMELFRALREITERIGGRRDTLSLPPYEPGLIAAEPGAVWFSDSEFVPLELAEGRTASAPVAAYPPGTGIIIPGAEISAEQIGYINMLREAGAEIAGMRDGEIEVSV